MITTLTFWLEQLQCEKRGCCWSPLDERNVPWCFFPTNHGYTVESVKRTSVYGKSPLCTLLSHSCTHKLVKIFDFLSFSLYCNLSVCLSHIVFPLFIYFARGTVFCEIWHGWHIRKHDWLYSVQVFHFLLDFTEEPLDIKVWTIFTVTLFKCGLFCLSKVVK